MTPGVAEVLKFWFDELTPEQWWKPAVEIDLLVRERFGTLHQAAAAGELWNWRSAARGRLAEVVVLDQFSRQLYRDDRRAYGQDGMALALAQEAVAAGADRQMPARQRAFVYLPYMHSESAVIHEQAMVLFAQAGLEENFEHEKQHKAVIDRFGRYPHRNAVLGRESTPEELAFLRQAVSGF